MPQSIRSGSNVDGSDSDSESSDGEFDDDIADHLRRITLQGDTSAVPTIPRFPMQDMSW